MEATRPVPCEQCGDTGRFVLQFHHGSKLMKTHSVGSPIEWGMNDEGERAGHVEVFGHPERCPVCGFVEDRMYVVVIDDDVITSYRLATQEDLETIPW